MRKRLLLFSAFIALTFLSNAQVPNRFENKKDTTATEEVKISAPEKKETDLAIWDRLVYGGNFTLSFGTNTFIYAAPAVGYKISEKLVGGAGFSYMYLHVKRYFNGNQWIASNQRNFIYGPKFFLNYFPFEKYIYLGTQYELLNHSAPVFTSSGLPYEYVKKWTPVLFIEAGYTEKIGRKGFMQIGIRYNLLHDIYSPYQVSWLPVMSIYF